MSETGADYEPNNGLSNVSSEKTNDLDPGWNKVGLGILITFGITGAVGFAIGVWGAIVDPLTSGLFAFLNVGGVTLAFFLVGRKVSPKFRWSYLKKVGIGTWLTGLINVAFIGVTVGTWFAGAFFVGLAVGIAGLLAKGLPSAKFWGAQDETTEEPEDARIQELEAELATLQNDATDPTTQEGPDLNEH